jgi:hypothetical protein
MEWPPNLTDDERLAVPHHILRLLNGEEYLHQLLKNIRAVLSKAG